MHKVRGSEAVQLLGAIDPENGATPLLATDWVAARDFDRFLGIVFVGAMTTNSEVTAIVQEATDDQGTSPQAVNTSATLTEAGGDDDSQIIVNARADEMSDGYTHLRLLVEIDTAASFVAGALYGLNARYGGEENHAATVESVV
jgi:hypothetical protein